jgi:hypothetical protein
MLLERGVDTDRQRARTLLDEAERDYEMLGMPRHRALAEAAALGAR